MTDQPPAGHQDNKSQNNSSDGHTPPAGACQRFIHHLELSTLLTVVGIVCLFATSVAVVLIAPRYVDPTWTSPSSDFQVQMYEVSDPHVYISSPTRTRPDLQFVQHLVKNFTLLSFAESEIVRIIAPPELEKYITRYKDPILKLTTQLLLLRHPKASEETETASSKGFDASAASQKLQAQLQEKWKEEHAGAMEKGIPKIRYQIYELYAPEGPEAFSVGDPDVIIENWVDQNFTIVDGTSAQAYHAHDGVIYVNNPIEYRVHKFSSGESKVEWRFDPHGDPIKSVAELTAEPLGFRSRKNLIEMGEHLYAIEGCWYCHTDQTRTLVQDVVLNGSDSYPAPPSSPNEYIYQKITFPGTRRIGPDLSRVGIKRPSRDWHKGHFWSPKTESPGSIMPSFKHLFDFDPSGTGKATVGVPSYQFEALFQYLMTKGTRITPPTEAWWLGKDPIQTIEIIEGRK